MKLLEAARAANYLPENQNLWHEWFSQTYGKPTEETILPTFQAYSERGYAGNSIVFGLMLARAMLFSEAVFKYRRRSDKALFGTADLLPLERPWPNGTTGELLVRMIQDADLAGNAFIRNDGDRLVRLRPDWVEIVRVGSGEHVDRSRWDVLGYAYHLNGMNAGPMEFYPIEDVAHWSPIPDPMADFRGMSWLTPVLREINSDIAMTDYKRRFMDNSATPNLLLKYSQALTPDALAKVRAQWSARYEGSEGLKTAILDRGADVTVIGSTMDSMRFDDIQAAGENRIAVAAGVPGIVAGLREGLQAATYSNYEQAMRRFADLTMRPLWRSACACLASLVAPQQGADLWYDVADIAALRQGEKERADTMQVNAISAETLIRAGYDPDSVTQAVTAGDLTLLTHTGLVSVQLLPKGQVLPGTAAADVAATADQGTDTGTVPPPPPKGATT